MRLLRRTPALLLANGISASIQGQFMFVVPWMMLARGSTPTEAALAAGLVFAPMLVVSVPAGIVSDRSEPARLMLVMLAVGIGACALYPAAVLAGSDLFGLVLLAALVTGTVRAFVEGAALREVGNTATAPWLLRRQTIRTTLNQAAIFASPFVGLLAYRAGGVTAVMLLVCVLHVAAGALALQAARLSVPRSLHRPSALAGMASFLGNRRLQWIGVTALVWNVFAGAALAIMPAVLREHVGLDEVEASVAFVVGGVAVVVLTLPVVALLQRRLGTGTAFLLVVGYLVGVALTAGLIGIMGFGALLALIALGLGATAVEFRRPLVT